MPGSVRMRGAALLVTLLIVAAASVMAAELVRRAHLDQSRTLLLADSERAWQLSAGLEALVRARLGRGVAAADLIEGGPVTFPVPGGILHGRLEDFSGRFNLNLLAVTDPDRRQHARRALRELLSSAGVDPQRSGALIDELDRRLGSTDGRGIAPLAELSELDRLTAWDEALRARLSAWLTVLPDADTALNINRTSPEVLAAWVEGLSREDAARVLARAPFAAPGDALAAPELTRIRVPAMPGRLATESHWLGLHVLVEQIGRAHV